MKKLFFMVVFLVSVQGIFACDACGCASSGGYMGILPQFTKHFTGIRYQFRTFSASSVTSPGARNQEYYHTWNAWGRFSPHKRVQIFVNVPVHYFLQHDNGNTRELSGIGDVWTLAQYQVISTPDSSEKKSRHAWMIGGGIKMPTGRYNLYDKQGVYERNMQPGTGSWDVMITTQYTVRWKGWGLSSEANARISTMNPDRYLYGHKLNVGTRGFYWKQWKKCSLLSAIGAQYDYTSKDEYLGQTVWFSGGHTALVTASADLYLKRIAIGVEVKLPVYSQMATGILNPGPQLMSQLLFMF